jgi:hypothetical protein
MPSERDPRITVRLTEELYAALKARAAEEGLKPAHVARRALEATLFVPVVTARVVLHRCPVADCDFVAVSSKARCPVHARMVVEA